MLACTKFNVQGTSQLQCFMLTERIKITTSTGNCLCIHIIVNLSFHSTAYFSMSFQVGLLSPLVISIVSRFHWSQGQWNWCNMQRGPVDWGLHAALIASLILESLILSRVLYCIYNHATVFMVLELTYEQSQIPSEQYSAHRVQTACRFVWVLAYSQIIPFHQAH